MNMAKKQLFFRVAANERLHECYSLLKLKPLGQACGCGIHNSADRRDTTEIIGEIRPGQFVQVAIPDAPHTFLRRPISVNNVEDGMLWLLVRRAGEGTGHLASIPVGQKLDLLLPLGNGFTLPDSSLSHPLLVGGGVGIAPMLYLAKCLNATGIRPEILIGARTAADLLQVDELQRYGTVHISTDDGSRGQHGVVTANSCLEERRDIIYCCGPTPMMHAVARYARHNNIPCFVSLENMMACGLGACLCCVEKTVHGNVCVCTDGPVFDINELNWED